MAVSIGRLAGSSGETQRQGSRIKDFLESSGGGGQSRRWDMRAEDPRLGHAHVYLDWYQHQCMVSSSQCALNTWHLSSFPISLLGSLTHPLQQQCQPSSFICKPPRLPHSPAWSGLMCPRKIRDEVGGSTGSLPAACKHRVMHLCVLPPVPPPIPGESPQASGSHTLNHPAIDCYIFSLTNLLSCSPSLTNTFPGSSYCHFIHPHSQAS